MPAHVDIVGDESAREPAERAARVAEWANRARDLTNRPPNDLTPERLADRAAEIAKGRKVAVEGRLQTRQWQDQQGQKRYSTEVVATHVEFVDGRGGGVVDVHERPDAAAVPDDGETPLPHELELRDMFFAPSATR